MKPSYVAISTSDAQQAALAAKWRRSRLEETSRSRVAAYVYDAVVAILAPAAIGVALSATVTAILVNVEGSTEWVMTNLYSESAIAALGATLSFIVATRLSANMSKNELTVAEFGNLCGATVNLAIFSRAFASSGDFKLIEVQDGFGGTFKTTELGLLLASLPLAVKYTYRAGQAVRTEMLPLGASPTLLSRVNKRLSNGSGRYSIGAVTAIIAMIASEIDSLEARRQIGGSGFKALVDQLNLVTAAEGSISGSVAYGMPASLDVMLYLTFVLYFLLLVATDLAPTNEWSSMLHTSVIIVCLFGVHQISRRYANAFNIRSGNSTQKPMITAAARDVETLIESVYDAPNLKSATPCAVLSLGKEVVQRRSGR